MVDNFLFNCMTQAEMALDGQDPGRMAEALRSILQGAYELHGTRSRLASPASVLPSRTTTRRDARNPASGGS